MCTMYEIKELWFEGDKLYADMCVQVECDWKYEKRFLGEIKSASNVFYENYSKINTNSVVNFDHKFNEDEMMLVFPFDDFRNYSDRPFAYFNNPLKRLCKVINYAIKQRGIVGVYLAAYLGMEKFDFLPKAIKYFIAPSVDINYIDLHHKNLLILVLIGALCNRTIIKHLPVNLVLLDLSWTHITMYKRISDSIKYLVLNATISYDYSNMIIYSIKSLSLERSSIEFIKNAHMKQSGYDRFGPGDDDIKHFIHDNMYICIDNLEYLNINDNGRVKIDMSECKNIKKIFYKGKSYDGDKINDIL
jgi:hypothetical protein